MLDAGAFDWIQEITDLQEAIEKQDEQLEKWESKLQEKRSELLLQVGSLSGKGFETRAFVQSLSEFLLELENGSKLFAHRQRCEVTHDILACFHKLEESLKGQNRNGRSSSPPCE